jgi:hypothetical protein
MWRGFSCILAGAAFVHAGLAVAQTVAPPPNGPLMGSEAAPGTEVQPQPAEPGAGFGGSDGIFRILVVGDALAGGFGNGVARMVVDDPRFEVVNRFNESSGLSRPELYDWVAAVPKIVIAKDYDAAIVHIGVNDRQDMRSEAGRVPFRSPEWIAAYKANAAALATRLGEAGLHVYWLTVPPMAEAGFDADMKFISGLQREAVTASGARIIDLTRYFLGADGRYVERGPDETGTDRKLRARDGIAFMKQGNTRVGQLLVQEIKSAEAQSTGVAADAILAGGAPQDPGPASATETGIVAQLPQFGQQGLDGEELAFNAGAFKPGTATPEAAKPAAAAAARPVITAAVGSAAELLFTTGESAAAPAGRFDDFSLPAQQ